MATMKIEFNCGENIENAFREAIRISKLLDIWVEFRFNGVPCCAGKNGVIETGVIAYQTELKKKCNYFTAFA